MNHLIQPITIESVKYCFCQHGGRITKGVSTNMVYPFAPPDVTADLSDESSPWIIPLGDNNYCEITFGVICSSSVTIHVSLASGEAEYSAGVDIWVDGDQQSVNYYEPGNLAAYGDIVITIPDTTYGSLVSVLVYDAMGPKPADLVATVEIISIL